MLVVFVLVLKLNQSDNTTNISPYTYTLYMTLVACYRLSDWFTIKTSTNTTNISSYAYTLYMTLVACYRLYDWFTFMYNVYV
jgi:hypothetical protein